MVRRYFFLLSGLVVAAVLTWSYSTPQALWSFLLVGPLVAIGLRDAFQKRHTVLRNFPLIGHGRWMIEGLRPEVQQYFIEHNTDANPVEREFRSLVYARAKNQLETRPFGTQRDVYRIGYEWAAHALQRVDPLDGEPRVSVGGASCSQPYSSSRLNVSAMSFGAISKNAVLALNQGAKMGGFAQNTGEGGLSPYHLEHGGDLIWQLGTGYFGCRTDEGAFDAEVFAEKAALPAVKMIELKLSQGAKPAHGGILPGRKVTPEIARIRGLVPYQDSLSPPRHSTFETPRGMMEFVARLRALAGGKPVGLKLCVGRRTDVFSICKAILETGIAPDYITVDGGEGGTGAAPLEFSNSIGMPLRDALVVVRNALVGCGLKDDIRVFASGKTFTAFHMIRAMALGADGCNTARGMMFALGCIQALRCNNDTCPTGITTQDPRLVHGLHVPSKAQRVRSFHENTIDSFLELLRAIGVRRPEDITPDLIYRRIDDLHVRSFAEIYEFLAPGALLDGRGLPPGLERDWHAACADSWSRQPDRQVAV